MPRKPAMPARTLKALKASIKHWEKNETGEFEGYHGSSCKLCVMFVRKTGQCDGCPVMEKTGRSDCGGTPWAKADRAATTHGTESRQFELAAKAMRKFLESLLP